MRRRRFLHVLAATALPAALAGCLGDDATGESTSGTTAGTTAGRDSETTTTAATTTVSCDAPSTLELADPEYDLGPSNQTPPVAVTELPADERRVALAAVERAEYVTCGDASALASLADRIEARSDLRAERHRERWTERGATVTPPAYLQVYYLEHARRRFAVDVVIDGETRLESAPWRTTTPATQA